MSGEVLEKLADRIAEGDGEFDLEKLKAFFAPLHDGKMILLSKIDYFMKHRLRHRVILKVQDE